MTPPPLRGRRPTGGQETLVKAAAAHWRKIANEAIVIAITQVEETAKQLIALTGTLQGLYFAIFAFSDLRQRVSNPLIQLLFFVPLVLWVGSLYFATRVFVPRVRTADLNDLDTDTWQRVRDAYGTTLDDKLAWLHWAHLCLIFSFIAVLILLAALVFLPAPPAARPTEIIILTPTPSSAPTLIP